MLLEFQQRYPDYHGCDECKFFDNCKRRLCEKYKQDEDACLTCPLRNECRQTSGNCIRVFATREIYDYIELHNLVKLTHSLPVAGGIYDQPAKDMEAIEYIDNELNRIQIEKQKELEKQIGK